MLKKVLFLVMMISSAAVMAYDYGCREKPSICTVTKEHVSSNDYRDLVLKKDGSIVKMYEDDQLEVAIASAKKLEAAGVCVYIE